MPTYEYACDACGASWEKEQRISENPLKKCPKCGAMKARRMISSGNFILKGGGWYSDLYSGPSNAKKKDGADAGDGAAAKKSGGDAKKSGGDAEKPSKAPKAKAAE